MAAAATSLEVGITQGKAGLVMIELTDQMPAAGVMASGTVITQGPPVRVLFGMTGITGSICLPKGFATLVTTVAGSQCMLAQQLKICGRVIKDVTIQAYAVEIATPVFFVAVTTGARRCFRINTVETLMLLAVSSDILVTGGTQGCLC